MTPVWLDTRTYPFQSRGVDIEGARVHYIDEGQGPTVLMVHGTPSWCYARSLLGSSAWYDALWARRERIARIPALLVWGARDPAFAKLLPRWRSVFYRAEVVELSDAGHAPLDAGRT